MRSLFGRFRESAKHVGRVLHATLREIFDEAAYDRFLKVHGLESSRRSYALYLAESDSERERRPRCC